MRNETQNHQSRMKLYPRLAVTGIAKNGRIYVPYLLTCVGMIMMYYILQFLTHSERVSAMKGGDTMQRMLSLGSGVFTLFALIFLFYSNSFLIRSRKREFGLYNILGMGKRNLARVLVWESALTSVISLAGGLFCGILFSKVAELCMAWILDGEISLDFSIEIGSLKRTAVLFLGIFVLVLCNSLFQVGKAKPVDLLHSTSVGEKPPKANWVLALLGAVILAAAYYVAVTIEDPMSALLAFFVAVAMVVVATYLLFIAGSVVLCRLLQKNKNYYYKANHFISVSSMMYRMKRNGAGLASICVLSTIVLVMLSSVVCLFVGNEDRLYNRYPKELEVYVHSVLPQHIDPIRNAVNETAEEYNLEIEKELYYQYLDIGGYFDEDHVIFDEDKLTTLQINDYGKIRDLYFVPLADYNRIMGMEETLDENEVLIFCPNGSYDYPTITLEGCETWKVKKQVEYFGTDGIANGFVSATILNSIFVFVPDAEVIDQVDQVQQAIYGKNASDQIWYYGFDVNAEESVQIEAANTLSQKIDSLKQADESFPPVLRSCRAESRSDFYALYNGLFVLGILLGAVFLCATVLIMYYKQVTEGYEDQAKFDIMQKVGMTKKEIRHSINSQMLTVFLLPLIVAGIHTCFAFPIVRKLLLLFGVINTKLLMITNLVCFLVFALFYTLVYLRTSQSYYRIVSGIGEKRGE